MKGFLDPKIEELLADKSDTERLQAIVFSIACLLSGPTPFQPPDFYHIPKRSGSHAGDLENETEAMILQENEQE